jgi:hypothetical protein
VSEDKLRNPMHLPRWLIVSMLTRLRAGNDLNSSVVVGDVAGKTTGWFV